MEIHLVRTFMTIVLHSYLLGSSDTSKKRVRSEFSCIVTCQGLYVTPLLLSCLSLLLFCKKLVLVCNEPQLKLWIPVLWIPHMTQFHTCSNNIVSNMGPTSLSIFKAILKHDTLPVCLASPSTDIIQEISHLIKLHHDQILFPYKSIDYIVPGPPVDRKAMMMGCVCMSIQTIKIILKKRQKASFICRSCSISDSPYNVHNRKPC